MQQIQGIDVQNQINQDQRNTFLIKDDEVSDITNLKIASSETEFLKEAQNAFNRKRPGQQPVIFQADDDNIKARLKYSFENVMRQQGYTKALNSFIKFYIRYKYDLTQYNLFFKQENQEKNKTFYKKSTAVNINLNSLIPNQFRDRYQIRQHKNQLYYLCRLSFIQGQQIQSYQLISLKFIYKKLFDNMKKSDYLNQISSEEQKKALQQFLTYQNENQINLFNRRIIKLGKPKGKFSKTRKVVKDYLLNSKDLKYAKKNSVLSVQSQIGGVETQRKKKLEGLTADKIISQLNQNDYVQRRLAKQFVEQNQQIQNQ